MATSFCNMLGLHIKFWNTESHAVTSCKDLLSSSVALQFCLAKLKILFTKCFLGQGNVIVRQKKLFFKFVIALLCFLLGVLSFSGKYDVPEGGNNNHSVIKSLERWEQNSTLVSSWHSKFRNLFVSVRILRD